MTVGVENVDKAIARARHIVVFFPVLLCIGDKEITVDVLDAERGEPNCNVRIREVAVDLLRRRRPEAGSSPQRERRRECWCRKPDLCKPRPASYRRRGRLDQAE